MVILAIIAFVILGYIGLVTGEYVFAFGIGLLGVVLVLLININDKLNDLDSRLDNIEKKIEGKDVEKNDGEMRQSEPEQN